MLNPLAARNLNTGLRHKIALLVFPLGHTPAMAPSVAQSPPSPKFTPKIPLEMAGAPASNNYLSESENPA